MVRSGGLIAKAAVFSGLLVGLVGVPAQGPRGFGGGFGGGGKVVTGKPYTAASTNTSVDKLADGTTITHSSTGTEARDIDGRTARSIATTNNGKTITRTTVFDPVAHTVTSWETGSTVATQFQLPTAPPGGGRGRWGGPGGPGAGGPGAGGPGAGGPGGGRVKPTVTTTALAPKSIAGDNATGVKTTITVATGVEGNDKPLVSTREVWTSTDLGIVLEEISDSPREGFHKMEVTSLSPGSPDSTLFQVPAGYTIKTQTRHRGE